MTRLLARRLVKYVNFIVAIVTICALALIWWYGWRPLPQRSGVLTAPVTAAAQISFDRKGTPHIRAANTEDALFLQGYVTAQDRLWQMDALRRFDSGELSEILGPAALDSDRESRRLRIRRIAEAAYATLPAQDRAALSAYTRGVNYFISTHLDKLPVEFTLIGYHPRPWSVIDSIMVCLHMFRTLTTTWKDELIKRGMMAEGDAEKVKLLYLTSTGETQPGSNAWAIAGSRSASGKPLLSNDMHLEYALPGIWYMVHLQAPDLDVAGVALPGAPGVIVGHNQRIAWGITNLQFDSQDLYIEKFDERTGRYEIRGQIEQARLERELIRVKGQSPTEVTVWVTRHGPIFVTEGQDRMVLRWVASEAGVLQYPIVDLNRARNWQEFTAAVSRFPGPGSNFVYADVDGNIGYHAAGRIPRRRGYTGDLPVAAASGEFDWDGYIPFEELPSVWNPASGIIVSANQNPFPRDYPYPVNGNFAPPYRFHQIRDLLRAQTKWKADDLLKVQTDVYSAFHKFLAEQVVAVCDRRGSHTPTLDPAIALLRGWNGQMETNLAMPFLTSLIYQHLRTSIAEAAAPGKAAAYDFSMGPAVVEHLLRSRPDGWFRDWDEMVLRAFVDAVEEGTRILGRDIPHWQYGAVWRATINHPVLHLVPVIGRYFDIGSYPTSGSSTSVKQVTRGLAPSMRMNADLGDWDNSLLNIQIGQSGQPLSRHYKDQWRDYYYGRSYPMQFRRIEASRTLEVKPAH